MGSVETMSQDIRKIQDASLRLLHQTGIRLRHPEIMAMVRDHGVIVAGDVARFPPERLMDLVSMAPGEFRLYAKNSRNDLIVGGENTCFAPCYGAARIVAPGGAVRPGCLKDYLDLLKLFHVSRFMDLNGGILIQPADMDARRSLALFTLASLLHTDKCLLAGAGDREQLHLHFNMLEMVFGGKAALSARPRVLAIVNTTSPLQMDEFALETLIQYTRRGQPVMISPTVMAGSTGPVTLAGTLVLSNAEALAGVALTQMVRPGCPVVYGCQSTASDMRTGGISSGAPERALCISYGAMLARSLGLPYRSGGADNDAPSLTPQAAAESMMNLMAAVTAGVNLVVHAAGILNGFAAVSLEKAVFDLEILSRLRRWQQGVSWDATELAEEVIRHVGIGGEYLTSRHTFDNCRKALWIPEVSSNEPLGERADVSRDISRCTEKAERMIGRYQVPFRDMKLETALVDFMRGHDYPEDLLAQLVSPPG